VIDAGAANWEEQAEVAEDGVGGADGGDAQETHDAERETRNQSIADCGVRIAEWVRESPRSGKRVVHIFNKADLLPDPAAFLVQVRERYPHAVLTSANPQSAIRNPHWVESRRCGPLSACPLKPSVPSPRSACRWRMGSSLPRLHRAAEVMGKCRPTAWWW